MSGYPATLLDHALAPRNGGVMESPDAVGRASLDGRAPRIAIYLRVAEGRVTGAMFQAFGCGVTIACCSALTEMVAGRFVDECRRFTPQAIDEVLSGIPAEKQFCAQLAIDALRDALMRLPGGQPVPSHA